MNTITIEKKWSGENLTNRTGGDGPAIDGSTTTLPGSTGNMGLTTAESLQNTSVFLLFNC